MPLNQLAAETSPYLLQHAEHPVAWHAWNATSLALAKTEDKPILLSIGYSACHWCHVMAHESFEDPTTAELMNHYFVNIKVDREERPDLDKIYQLAHAVLTRRNGGWPLTVFLTPDEHLPFFAGTYFPPHARYGLPGFQDVLQRVADYYRLHREDIRQQTGKLQAFFQGLQQQQQLSQQLDSHLLDACRQEMTTTFDEEHGGFGRAPKFPHPCNLERALRQWAHDGKQADDQQLHIAAFSMEKMARGGLYDQLGGGFYRYAVDTAWAIPHFEKMLYDNAPLLALCADIWAATGVDFYRQVAVDTAAWVMREMQLEDGAYCATLDADSAGKEGHFYVWSRDDIKARLGDDYSIFAAAYGLNLPANFENEWHLFRAVTDGELGQRFNLPLATIEQSLIRAKANLLAVRETRERPARDEKILTSWNAMMIKAMSMASRRFNDASYLTSAERALAYLRQYHWQQDHLLAVSKQGKAQLPAYLDDYAFLLDAVLDMLQSRWRGDDLRLAIALAELLLHNFQDQEHGGFYFTANQHETLIYRPKPMEDEATPAGNGVAAFALNRLGLLLGDSRYLQAAEDTLKNAQSGMQQAPMSHASLMHVLEEISAPLTIIVLRGDVDAMRSWQQMLQQDYAPRRLVFAIPADETELPDSLQVKAPQATLVAYVCSGLRCSAPYHVLDDVLVALRDLEH